MNLSLLRRGLASAVSAFVVTVSVRDLQAARTEISLPSAPALTAPRLTGARIAGVMVNRELLHTLTALGAAPLTFSVTGLPSGLAFDPATGRITGTLAAAGKHEVTVKVTNSAGADARTLTIVAGDTTGLTPAMGWNSYDSFDDSITEAEFLEQARWQAQNLLPYGWQYAVVDFRWYDGSAPASDFSKEVRNLTADANGRLQPATSRFPSATAGTGFKSLANQVHALGLKFGIHIMRGMARQSARVSLPIANSNYKTADAADTGSTCGWNLDMYGVRGAAGQAWYQSLLEQYAAWGIDFVKVDDLAYRTDAGHFFHEEESTFIRQAINGMNRSIVFSTSPGNVPVSFADHLLANANMWRMSADYWDRWADLRDMFDLAGAWQGKMAPGHFPDADMLPLGFLGPRAPVEANQRTNSRTRFTHNEQVSMLTLWATLPSPLMLGANMVRSNDAFMMNLLTNLEMIDINQDALAAGARSVKREANREVWVRKLSGDRQAVALFNHAADDQLVSATFAELGLQGKRQVRDVWQRKDLGALDTISFTVPYHGAALFLLTPVTSEPPSNGTGGVGGAAGASAGGSAGAANGGQGSAGAGGVAGTAGSVSVGGVGTAATGGAGTGGGAGTSGASGAGGANSAGGSSGSQPEPTSAAGSAGGVKASGGTGTEGPSANGGKAPAAGPDRSEDDASDSSGCTIAVHSETSRFSLASLAALLIISAKRRARRRAERTR